MRHRFLLSIASLVTLAATTPEGARAAEETGCRENGSKCTNGHWKSCAASTQRTSLSSTDTIH